MKARALLVLPLLFVTLFAGCSLFPGSGTNRALRDISRLRGMKEPVDKLPQLVHYLSFTGGPFEKERVARAAEAAIVETGWPAILYVEASLNDVSRGKQAQIYLLRAYTEIEGSGAVNKLLEISRDSGRPLYLRVEAVDLIAKLRWRDAKPYLKYLSEDEALPKELRDAAKHALGHV
jgi:uncharacterized protein (UPF0147 family)